MEYNYTKPSGHINSTVISKGQKWILAIFCIVLFTSLAFSIYYSSQVPICVFVFLVPIIGTYYTILFYRGTYTKSKKGNWLPLAIGITCIFIQSLIFFLRQEHKVFTTVISLVYISGIFFLYKWETIAKTETRWIAFLIIIISMFFFNIFYFSSFIDLTSEAVEEIRNITFEENYEEKEENHQPEETPILYDENR